MKLTFGKPLAASIAAAITLSTAISSSAHHSIVAEFDIATEFELRGAVTKVEWFNPHIWIGLDVTAEDGSVQAWQCEMGASPNRLIRQGWKKDDLPLGTVIRATARPARDGSNTCSARSLTLDDGTVVFANARGGNQ